MSKALKLHLQVTDGHLRLLPKGKLNILDVDLLLGAARSGLGFFPVIIIDLVELGKVDNAKLDLLENGLAQIIRERKFALSAERPQLRWTVHKLPFPESECACGGNCQNCPCQHHKHAEIVNQKNVKPGRGRE
ncbi:MAG: hypothetical protein PHW74_11670 [Desulfobacca sp.]|nr:hypothetical protein [Desulfobacca sp.]